MKIQLPFSVCVALAIFAPRGSIKIACGRPKAVAGHCCCADGRPRYYHDRAQPIDIQCASQGIETLVKFSDHHGDTLAAASRVARWAIEQMQETLIKTVSKRKQRARAAAAEVA